MFGDDIRADMFLAPAKPLDWNEICIMDTIGKLFKDLAFPVVTALLILRPRGWRGLRTKNSTDEAFMQWPDETFTLVHELRIATISIMLYEERWTDFGMVNTIGIPDVQQRIDLLRMISW